MSRFIVIEGLIGVGKTSLCRLLRDQWNARLILEPAEDNPFLKSFYSDPARFAFPTQMFYLASRYAQQMVLGQGDLFHDLTVSDYLWAKDRLFAEETLERDELGLYDRFADLLRGHIREPDFIVFLDAPTDVVLERIGRRAIEAEQTIPPAYLESLRNRYYGLWDRYSAAPVYVVDTTQINYVDDPGAQAHMLDLLTGWLEGNPRPHAPRAYERPAQQLNLF